MKKTILIVLGIFVFLAISSCSHKENNNKDFSLGTDDVISINESNTIQPNY